MTNYDDLNPQPPRWAAWAIIMAGCTGIGLTAFTLALAVVEVV